MLSRERSLVTRRTLAWLVALAVTVTLVATVAVTLVFLPDIARRLTIVRLEALTQRHVEIDRVELNMLTGHVAVRGLRIAERDGPGLLARVDRIEGRIHRRSLWSLQVWIEDLTIAGSEVHVVRLTPTRFNISDLLDRPAQPPGRIGVTIDRLRIGESVVRLEDRTLKPPRTWSSERIGIEARDLSTEKGGGSAEGSTIVAGAPVSVHVEDLRLAPVHLRAHVTVANVDLGLIRLYLPGDAAVLPESGILAAGVDVVHDARDGIRISAGARVRNAALERRGQDGTFASSPEVTITLNDLLVKGREFAFARAEVEGDLSVVEALYDPPVRYELAATRLIAEDVTWPSRRPGRVSFAGSLPGGGRVDVNGTIASDPPRADVNVRAVRLPADLVNRYARLTGIVGGMADVDARVVASLPDRQPRVSVTGAAGVTRLVVADPAQPDRPPVGVERLDASGIEYEWPAKVKVGLLHLRKPWAEIQRDASGAITLGSLFVRRDAPAPGEPATETAKPAIDAVIDELRVQEGVVTVVDATVTPAARLRVNDVALNIKNAAWPARGPALIALDAGLPGGGALNVNGNGELDTRTVRVKLVAKDVDLAQVQPYLPFRARVQGRLSADTDVRGRLDPMRVRVRGSVGLSDLAVTDRDRQLLTVTRFDATGIDYRSPARLVVDRVVVQKPWAAIDRDERGELSLKAALEALTRGGGATGAPPAPTLQPDVVVREAVIEDGGLSIVDDTIEPAARFTIRGMRVELRNASWPMRTTAEAVLATPMPRGGRLQARGTLQMNPTRMEATATLQDVALSPAQPYLPFRARVSGAINGEAQVSATFDPFSVRVRSNASLKDLAVGDSNRDLLTTGRAAAEGVDAQWPGRVRVERIALEKPWLLLEREESGVFPLIELLRPRAPAAGKPKAGNDPGAAARSEPLAFTIGTLSLSDGFGRFVDRTADPDFAEELSGIDLTVSGVGTLPEDKARIAVRARLGPSAPLSISGELGTIGKPPAADLLFTLSDYSTTRSNAYLETLFGWTSRQGILAIAAHYRIQGDELDATNDVGVAGLQVVRAPARARPPKWPVGMPLDLFVSLLKNVRGDIELSLPVSGRLSSPQFDLGDAIWSALRGVGMRTVGLPFTLIGRLFVTEDSRIQALKVDPVTFVTGTATPAPEMTEHLDRLAAFLKAKPAVRAQLRAVLTVADAAPLKRAALLERLRERAKSDAPEAVREQALRVFTRRYPKREPPAALDDLVGAIVEEGRAPAAAETALASARVAAVRQALTQRGVEDARLLAPAGAAGVETEGVGRVEFEIVQ
jgi:uncharacterized protein involved in outer membrane biogenesis